MYWLQNGAICLKGELSVSIHTNSWDTWREKRIDKAAGWFSGIELSVPLGWNLKVQALACSWAYTSVCMHAAMLLFWQLEKQSKRETVTIPRCFLVIFWDKIVLAPNSLNNEASMTFWCLMTPSRLAWLGLHYWEWNLGKDQWCSRDLATPR